MEPGERIRFFNDNKTSIFHYPKGIPDIEKYLIDTSDEEKKSESMKAPEDLLTQSYRQHSQMIRDVSQYIRKEAHLEDQYQGNILVNKQLQDQLDNVSP